MTRRDLADQASELGAVVLSEHDVFRLEVTYQKLPPPEILRPCALALGLDLTDVLERAGYL